MMESPNDTVERLAQRAFDEASLELRAWNSLESLMRKIPEGMRQRLLRQACDRYGVTD